MENGGELLHSTTIVARVERRFPAGSLPAVDQRMSVCVACCCDSSIPQDTALAVVRAFAPIASARAILLAEAEDVPPDRVDVVTVPRGTKLSKLRWLADQVSADLLCICDPDLTVDEACCRLVLGRAAAEVRNGAEIVAFGVIDGRDDGTTLSRVLALDKWLSHRILRPCLWAFGVGITLPGQFLIVSPSVLRSLSPVVDSYLDDLYLGWVAWSRNIRVHRVPVVVGVEEPRRGWWSLLAQRIRWMRGLACLFGHLVTNPTAMFLLSVHFLAYHGLPVLALALTLSLVFVNPTLAFGLFIGLAVILSITSRRSFFTAITFLAVFPAIHLLATLLWWVPLSESFLRRR